MRSLLAIMILATLGGTAQADGVAAKADEMPLWDAELRLGYGVSVGGAQGMTTTRTSPLTITAVGAVALSYEPPLAGWGGLVVETLDRTAVGATAGIRFMPMQRRIRLSGGGVALVAPYTLYGATAAAGTCFGLGGMGLRACADVQMTAYFAGDDLAPGAAVTQLQLVLGVAFDGP